MKSISTILIAAFVLLASCEDKPTIIRDRSAGDFVSDRESDLKASSSINSEEKIHVVNILESMDTERYTYLKVAEEGTEYWIAVARQSISLGESYYYQGGIFKHNFESPELGRVFKVLYLVSEIIQHPTLGTSTPEPVMLTKNSEKSVSIEQQTEGSTSLSDLFADPSQFEGQIIEVSGKIVKVNNGIMNRNWLHLQDGSGENLDLTITTSEEVVLNSTVTLKGKISLNVDFGAGYFYDVIMENATVQDDK